MVTKSSFIPDKLFLTLNGLEPATLRIIQGERLWREVSFIKSITPGLDPQAAQADNLLAQRQGKAYTNSFNYPPLFYLD